VPNSSPSRPVRCLVADDHPPIAELVGRYLEHQGISVVGPVADGDAALALAREAQPDVALLDARMPGLSGVEVARELGRSTVATAVVVYTGYGDRALLADALDAGARGFVQKEAALGEVVRAVRLVAGGGTYVDPVLAAAMLRDDVESERPRLTARERDVLRLLADGLANEEIGRRLYISPDTVRAHLRKAMHKLDAGTRTEAVATALRQSLIT
jgi:DNA-binding NarL/FixJ family response regulator